ncbi:MAG: zf-HC2 domain-containing protein [Gemmatimonadota bacterium]
MITVPRHVIVDLLPLYLAGELSPETRDVVEGYLQTDVVLAAGVQAAAADSFPFEAAGVPAVPDLELQSVRRTRALLARLRWLFGLGLAFTAIGLSVAVSLGQGRVENVHLMMTDYPLPFGGCLLTGIGCWVGYQRLKRQLRG